MKIYLDVHKEKGIKYIEDKYSSADILANEIIMIMKEVSIEEKAYDGNYEVYSELINRLEDVKDAIKKQNYEIAMDILCKPYPKYLITTSTELKESEDERIRKELIDFIYDKTDTYELREKSNSWLAWLEKQESVGEIVERCKNSWYNEGKIAGQFEELSDEEKYLQGWHDAVEKLRKKRARRWRRDKRYK